ncbi:beta-eliminating lyase-related protein [Sinomonas mesophila]|uniref:beta-eliminating lyase-related protein n=1 Tax=Sinomonas mesophila TaxID=1531955 RepID=UPI003CCB977F
MVSRSDSSTHAPRHTVTTSTHAPEGWPLHDVSARGFASDNISGAHPEVLAALAAANGGYQASYGHDQYTARLQEAMRGLFGDGVETFPVFNGTGANVLSLQRARARVHPGRRRRRGDLWRDEERHALRRVRRRPQPRRRARPDQSAKDEHAAGLEDAFRLGPVPRPFGGRPLAALRRPRQRDGHPAA